LTGGVIVLGIIVLNAVSIKNDFVALAGIGGVRADFNVVYLGELEKMADYITVNSDNQKTVYLDGNKTYLFKAAKSLAYLTGKQGVELVQLSKKDNVSGQIIFYLLDSKAKEKTITFAQGGDELLEKKEFGRFLLLKLKVAN
jgi:hypothetical protein